MYWFNVRRGRKEIGRRRGYSAEFDILALVALDIRVIAYVPIFGRIPQTVRLQSPGYTESPAAVRRGWGQSRRAKSISQFPIEGAMAALTGARPVLPPPSSRVIQFRRPEQETLFSIETTA